MASANLLNTPLEQALESVRRWKPVPDTECVSLCEGCSRVLAENVIANVSLPHCDNSAMDGYAFKHADLPLSRLMPIFNIVSAGDAPLQEIPQGTAVRILTGAAMPGGCDTVAIQEDCAVQGATVLLPSHIQRGANRRLAGEDIRFGDTVLSRGARLRPQDIGLAAAVGRVHLLVRRRVKVALLAIGDELCPPGTELQPGQIYDANRYALSAALTELGAIVTDLGIVPDNPQSLGKVLISAASIHDLVISSGGMSVGDKDFVKSVVKNIGSLDVQKVAIKPGKPVALGEVAGVPFVGLPGNPVAALVTFWLLARPLLLQIQGASESQRPTMPVISTFHRPHRHGLHEYLRVGLGRGEGNRLEASAFKAQGSGIWNSLIKSDGLLEVPSQHGDVHPGDILEFTPYFAFLN